ncbi:YiaA/YiaB family protein [Leucobacter rhizosphaerae]|uniref:YiaA/YiaB family protein n=1 Tax=Leucobacter rhizosphaerae TaxID=2932245 RepID=A0ABY4FZB9_9MICO|nr:inner membrane protein YiaA [Leucobacter rhizosphaerae]UOQ61648.1 YiaA/YiaB family protein [Leucobacter rhizosphaerae]
MTEHQDTASKPTAAFIGASWVALLLGMGTYLIGLYNATMELNEKGYYFTLLMFGLFAAVSLQKTVRDRADGIPVTNLYTGIAWFALLISLTLLAVGLWNAGSLTLSEKGFYGIAFAMSLFASVAVQKNVRDLAKFRGTEDAEETASAGSPAVYPFTQPQEAQH